MDSLELTHPTLLHPRTGKPLQAVGTLPNGRIVWPILGGDGSEADANDAGNDAGDTDQTSQDDQGQDTGDQDDTGNEDSGDDKDPRVQRANRQAAQYRTQLRETQQQLTELQQSQEQSAGVLDALRQALTGDSGEDGQTDPAEQLATLTSEAETLRTTNQQLQAHLLVHELAAENDGNPNALLDSRRFTDKLAGLDPAADDYRDQVAEAIKDAASTNSTLRATGQVPSRGGSETAGQGAGSGAAVTADQFAAMSYAQRTELFRTNPSLYRQLAGTAT